MSLKHQFTKGIENNSKYPALETLRPRITYSLTINPEPEEHLRIKTNYEKMLSKILPLFFGGIKLNTELSTKNQNIHYHGTIRWKDDNAIGWFYLSISSIKQYCQFEIDTIEDWGWNVYCIKQQHIMSRLCDKFKVPSKIKYNYKKS